MSEELTNSCKRGEEEWAIYEGNDMNLIDGIDSEATWAERGSYGEKHRRAVVLFPEHR